jgi:hypothetical protein
MTASASAAAVPAADDDIATVTTSSHHQHNLTTQPRLENQWQRPASRTAWLHEKIPMQHRTVRIELLSTAPKNILLSMEIWKTFQISPAAP